MLDDNPKMTTQQWVMEGLARAFGVCVTLREDPFDLSEEQIKQRIVEDGKRDVDWYQKELNKAKEEYSKQSIRTKQEWKMAWLKHEAQKKKENAISITKAEKIKQCHDQVLSDLKLLLISPKTDELTKNIAKFGISQLNLVESECRPCIQEPTTLANYKAEVIKSTKRDIEYHTEEIAKAKQRANERITLYTQLKHDVETVLGSTSKQ